MQSEEQQLIDGLFDRLKQAESQTGARDQAAEQRIQARIREQPAAPYYMAQSIIIQEAALKRMDQRVKALEAQVNTLQQQAAQSQQSSGGFLSNLFGGAHRPAPQQTQNYQAAQQNQAAWNNAPQQPYSQPAAPVQAAPSRAGSFIGGALQTAAGVAGGVMLADMLTGMFHHSQPEEIVNIINDEPMPVNTAEDQNMFQEFDQSNNLDTFNGTDDRYASNGFLDNQNDTFGSDDSFGDDSFNSDDDSFL
ncbi:DUF2076 domain-containing protein [Chimaeribacter arupi]|uniref:DUF2076 domain-containing protein n=1 Tax=Chimaeribacter arupi TaxID=2060066 RepID=A0A2N5EIV9_9GAMM|nr:DUF2076 domain-containing protein [Chimaeribacter arupi]PLR45175.1 DUF2076 domain-containing protein [Chimaeribacter arupi]